MSSEDKYNTSEKTKEDIQEAVDNISNFFSDIENLDKTRQGKSSNRSNNKDNRKRSRGRGGNDHENHRFMHYDSNHHHRRYLWIAVGFLTLLIIGLWIFNVRTSFYDFQHTENNQVGELLNNTQGGLGSILSDFNQITENLNTNITSTTETTTIENTNVIDKELEQAIQKEIENMTETTTTSTPSTTVNATITVSTTDKNTSTNSNTSN